MNLIELFTGTYDERFARENVRRLKAKPRLNKAEQRTFDKSTPLSRRLMLRQMIFGGTAIGLTLLGGGGAVAVNVLNQPPQLGRPDLDYLDEEVARLGISPDPAEEALFREAGFHGFARTALVNPTQPITDLIQEGNRRIDMILEHIMPRSANPYMRDAANFINTHRNQTRDLAIVPDPQGLVSRVADFHMGFDPSLQSDNFRWSITPSTQSVLGADPVDLALQFVHEGKHIMVLEDLYNGLPSGMSLDQKRSQILADLRGKWVLHEARAYGTQDRAMIYHYGLTRDKSLYTRSAAMLIATGNDIEGANWQKFVNQEYVSKLRPS